MFSEKRSYTCNKLIRFTFFIFGIPNNRFSINNQIFTWVWLEFLGSEAGKTFAYKLTFKPCNATYTAHPRVFRMELFNCLYYSSSIFGTFPSFLQF